MNQHQKRKRRHGRSDGSSSQFPSSWISSNQEESTRPEDSIYIEAHEADLIMSNAKAAMMLEAPISAAPLEKGALGSGLVKWEIAGGTEDIWVDRYDARLLLSSLPNLQKETPGNGSPPPSPTGWSDLPSDTEDTFFLDESEVEAVRREKRRRLLDATRNERLRAMQAADPDGEQEEVWGDDTEEPDSTLKELMRRTAAHLLSSPNPVQLEARILANHGADRRFAFLRGRWRNAWVAMKQEVRVENVRKKLEEEESMKKASSGSTLMGLADYGDSEDEDDPKEAQEAQEENNTLKDDAKREERRARAKEWAAKRRAEKAIEDTTA